MKNKITALILAVCMLGGAAWSASAAEYGGWSGADDISTYSTSRMDNLDIPNITSTSTVYDPDGMVNIEVVYAAPDADGTLKVTVLNEIDALTAGASFRAAVITNGSVNLMDNRGAGITEYLNETTDEDGMGYVLPGSYYILEPGTYYSWSVAASDAFCLVVTNESGAGSGYDEPVYDEPVFDEPVYDRWDDSVFDDSIYDGLGQDPNYGDPYYDEENEVFTDAEGNRFYPGNGVTNDVLITAGGDRFELTVPLAGTYSYEVGTSYGTMIHTEYLVWPDCELILPDNGKIYDNYTFLHSLGMGDYVEGGCELYGGDVIRFDDPRLSCDDNGVFYGEDYTVNFLDPEITFRVVVNDITEYIPDYYDGSAGEYDMPAAPAPAAPSYSASSSFTDVAENAWYYDDVLAAADAGIIAGNADGSFNPGGKLTWAQAVTFAVRLAQYRAGTPVYGAADQTSVWYQIYVDYAWNSGIITYIPQDVNYIINRAEAALIFAKVLGNAPKINVIPENYFWDLYGSGEVGEAVNKLAEAGIVNGMEDGSFGANDNFLRSQVAAVVARMAGLIAPVRIG
ncbi:MAG: S-layer homology domain-containing protein [Clostridia bacterium]|nr:S-layer homology domain-containing protein [Clostridia bacterium]